MGIDPKPFDPETYVEEDVFVTDESGSKKRLSLVNNIVRWRKVKKPDGTTTVSELYFSKKKMQVILNKLVYIYMLGHGSENHLVSDFPDDLGKFIFLYLKVACDSSDIKVSF